MIGLLQSSLCLVTHGELQTAQIYISFVFLLWPLNCPFYFLRSAVGLIAKWAVCKYTGHTTNTRVIHRRGLLAGNQDMTWNVIGKISYLQPRPTFSHVLLVTFWKVTSHTAQLHFQTMSFSPWWKLQQPLLPTTSLLAFFPFVLSTDWIQGITDQALFKVGLYAWFHQPSSQEDFGIVLDYFKMWFQMITGNLNTLLDAALSVMLTLQSS